MRAAAVSPVIAPRPAWRSALVSGACLLLLAIACFVVWRGALGTFFSQDDFAYLGRAAGLYPRLDRPWRWLSAQAYFDVMRPLAGLSPLAYHGVSLALHFACAALLGGLLARRLDPVAAWLGAMFFALHPAAFTVVHWVSSTGDSLAFALALLSLAAWLRADATRWLALPLFVLALLAKESALPLPLAMAAFVAAPPRRDAARARDERPRARPDTLNDPLWWTLLAISIVVAALLALDDASRAAGTEGARPYALSIGNHLVLNALTYAGWTVNAWLPTMRGFSDAPDRAVWLWGGAAMLLWCAGLVVPGLRSRGWTESGTWFQAFLLPYLPLAHHTYHYYLYLPLAGAAGGVAIVADAVLQRPGSAARRLWMRELALVIGAALAVNGALLVRKIETHPMPIAGLLSDPVLDRARIASRVDAALRGGLPDGPVNVAILVLPPPGASAGIASYVASNVRAALYDGLALRVLHPHVATVRFMERHEPLDDSWRWVLARADGESRVIPSAELDSLVARYGPPR